MYPLETVSIMYYQQSREEDRLGGAYLRSHFLPVVDFMVEEFTITIQAKKIGKCKTTV